MIRVKNYIYPCMHTNTNYLILNVFEDPVNSSLDLLLAHILYYFKQCMHARVFTELHVLLTIYQCITRTYN